MTRTVTVASLGMMIAGLLSPATPKVMSFPPGGMATMVNDTVSRAKVMEPAARPARARPGPAG